MLFRVVFCKGKKSSQYIGGFFLIFFFFKNLSHQPVSKEFFINTLKLYMHSVFNVRPCDYILNCEE